MGGGGGGDGETTGLPTDLHFVFSRLSLSSWEPTKLQADTTALTNAMLLGWHAGYGNEAAIRKESDVEHGW